MKYLCLVYLSKDKWNACPDAVCFEAGSIEVRPVRELDVSELST